MRGTLVPDQAGDLAGYDPDDVRTVIGGCAQDPHIFDTTIRDNLRLARPGASDTELAAAAAGTRLLDWIESLPRGWDTLVGSNGATLSGGQRQRIALARAILSDPRILILDDATSAIDSKIEESIYHGLRSVLADRTTLLIAHRQSTLRLADRIVVLSDGRVAEQGTHEDLLAVGGSYARLFRLQAAGYQEVP
jgi:ABC-type multidrug transport system fused ATPase/permease subunit